jgi:hypothetical protein
LARKIFPFFRFGIEFGIVRPLLEALPDAVSRMHFEVWKSLEKFGKVWNTFWTTFGQKLINDF